MKPTILIVDDEEDILELLRYNLTKDGYNLIEARTGEEALRLAVEANPQLMILDLMLPGIDGLEVCRRLKNNPATKGIQIIMLTAKSDEADIVVGLEFGADDYIVKPFSPRVLNARVKAVLRRPQEKDEPGQEIIRYYDLTIYPEKFEVTVNKLPVELTATEFRILHFLAQRPGWVFSRAQIVDAVRGEDYPVTDRSVDVHIVSLRKKLGDHGSYIETMRGIGYRLKEEI